MPPTARRSTSTTAPSTATSSACAASSARSTASSSRSKRFMASDTDTATPDRGSRPSFWASLKRLWLRRAPPSTRVESPSLLRRRRTQGRRHSPLTRRILLLNIVPVVLLALGAVYLSDYEDELIDAELASLLVQGEMVAA